MAFLFASSLMGVGASSASSRLRARTVEQVQEHSSADDCWIVAHGKVYAVPKHFMKEHPGGQDSIGRRAGLDATRDFDFHSKSGKKSWEVYCIGRLT